MVSGKMRHHAGTEPRGMTSLLLDVTAPANPESHLGGQLLKLHVYSYVLCIYT